jgi:hypothetical protein
MALAMAANIDLLTYEAGLIRNVCHLHILHGLRIRKKVRRSR